MREEYLQNRHSTAQDKIPDKRAQHTHKIYYFITIFFHRDKQNFFVKEEGRGKSNIKDSRNRKRHVKTFFLGEE